MSACRNLHLPRFALGKSGVSWVAEVTDRLGSGHQFEQQLKALSRRFGRQKTNTGEISARSVEAINEADLNRVGTLHKNDRDRLGRRFGCERTLCAFQDNDH